MNSFVLNYAPPILWFNFINKIIWHCLDFFPSFKCLLVCLQNKKIIYLVDNNTILIQDSDLRVVTESLDKLFDVFTEDYTDNIFFSLNLIPKLKSIENSFKIKLKMQKGELSPDSVGIINMAKLNLKRFIKYKEKRCKW